MGLATVLAVVALIGSIMLLQMGHRIYPSIAVLASGLEVAIAFRLITVQIHGVSLVLVLGAALAIAGGSSWVNAQKKSLVAAASIVTFIGAIQVLRTLRIVG